MQTTTTQSEILQAKVQTIAQTLDKQVIVATKGKQQHVKVKSGYLYEISLKEGEVLNADANLIVKKTGNSLEVLLEDNTAVIFDGYLAVCATDLSCLVSLPNAQGVHYVVENIFTPTANDSQIVYFYGDETALLDIAKSQSGSFEQSFSEVFLSSNDTSVLVDLISFAFLGGGGGGGGEDGDSTRSIGSQLVNQNDYFNLSIADYFPLTDNSTGSVKTYTNRVAGAEDETTPPYSATLAGGDPLPTWLDFDEITGIFSGTPDNADVDEILITVTATDDSGYNTLDTFIFTINNVNDAPVATDIDNQSVDEHTNLNLSVASYFSDPDGDTLTYHATLAGGDPLPTWLIFDTATGIFSGTPDNNDVGEIIVAVIATDDSGLSALNTFILTVNNINDAPEVANPINDKSVNQGENFHLSVNNVFTDIDVGDTLTYSATLENGNPLPTWLSFDATTGTFDGTPDNADVGEITIRVTATDDSGASVSTTLNLTVNNVNDAPVATNIDNQSVDENSNLNLSVASHFSDADGNTLTYSATLENGDPLPTWLSFDTTTGTFSGTAPEVGANETFRVIVTASDGALSTSGEFNITVNDVNKAPVATNIDNQSVNEHANLNLSVASYFSDPDGNTLIYSATLANGNPLPTWLSFDTTTGELSGTAPEVGANETLRVTVTASDGALSTSGEFNITVNDVNKAPVATNINDQSVDENSNLNLSIVSYFSDPDGNTLTYSATLAGGGSLPTWLDFDTTTGEFIGTAPEVGANKIITVVVTASDGELNTSREFNITVNDVNKAPVATDIDDYSVAEKSDFNLSVASHFSDADGDTLIYSATLEGGNPLPTWLSFDTTTGTFSGIPDNADVGEITITVTATDDSGLNASDTFSINVIDTTAPKITNITSSTENGYFKAGDEINISVEVDSEMSPDSQFTITLNNNQEVLLTRDPTDTKLYTDTYLIEDGDDTNDLTVTVIGLPKSLIPPTDLAGNILDSTIPDGYNLGDNANLVIDTIAPKIASISSGVTLRTQDGRYNIGDEINISVEVDSEMSPDSQFTITLNNNQEVLLTRDPTDTKLYTDRGTTVYDLPSSSFCNSDDLLRVEKGFFPKPQTPATDVAGNILTLDIPDDNNLDNNSALTVMNVVIGTNSNDILSACNNVDTRMYGRGGNDDIRGKVGDDKLFGENGNDKLYGGAGNDALYGGLGNDHLVGENGNDHISGDNGDDNLYGQNGNDHISGDNGDDNLYGQNGNDDLYGEDGNDKLYGGAGNDNLWGGRGNDTFVGGSGKNILTGGAGSDIFDYDRYQTNNDTITDFQVGIDKINIADVMKKPGHYLDMGMFSKLMGGKIVEIADDNGTDTTINIDTNLDGGYNRYDVTIILQNVSGYDLSDMIKGGYILDYF